LAHAEIIAATVINDQCPPRPASKSASRRNTEAIRLSVIKIEIMRFKLFIFL
jgi:hypothetical protein